MDRRQVGLAVGLVIVSTLLVTSSLIGVLAVTEGLVDGVGGRIPYYVLAAAAVFVGLVVVLETRYDEGSQILSTSVIVAATALVVISLSFEGFFFGLKYPSKLFSNLMPYFLAAGLISTGLIIWAVRHWREYVHQTRVR